MINIENGMIVAMEYTDRNKDYTAIMTMTNTLDERSDELYERLKELSDDIECDERVSDTQWQKYNTKIEDLMKIIWSRDYDDYSLDLVEDTINDIEEEIKNL